MDFIKKILPIDKKDYILQGISITSQATAYHFYKKYVIYQKYSNKDPKSSIMELIGNTPIVYQKSLSEITGCEIYIKLESQNPGGSVKDRAAKHMIQNAMSRGEIKKGDTIYEGTSGSTGISLGLIGNYQDLKTKIFLPNNLTEEKYRILETCNCQIVKQPPLNYIDEGSFVRKAQIEAKNNNGFFCDQFDNMDNYKGHFEETGPEIWEQMNGKISIYVNSAGTGATVAGVSNYLKSKNNKIKVILADPQGSSFHSKVKHGVLFTPEDREGFKERLTDRTIVEGVGQNRSTKNFQEGNYDDSFRVKDEEAQHMAHFLIENEGQFLGTSSALNLVGCVKTARKYKKKIQNSGVTYNNKVVIVTNGCDQGIRYLSKFYSEAYLKNRGINFVKRETYRNMKELDFIE